MSYYGDRQRLESEIKKVFDQAKTADEELQASLARFACILVSSYLEASCREIIEAYCQNRAHPSIVRYVQSHMRGFGNPTAGKILTLSARFGDDFKTRIEERIEGKTKEQINSVCAHRNNIAHGRQSSISIVIIKQYYEEARKLYQYLIEIFPGKCQ